MTFVTAGSIKHHSVESTHQVAPATALSSVVLWSGPLRWSRTRFRLLGLLGLRWKDQAERFSELFWTRHRSYEAFLPVS